MTCSTSAVAVWYSSNSCRSSRVPRREPRVFHRNHRLRRRSSASSAISLSRNGRTSWRLQEIAPSSLPSLRSGNMRLVRTPPRPETARAVGASICVRSGLCTQRTLSIQQLGRGGEDDPFAQPLSQVFRIAVGRSRAKKLAVEQKQAPERRAAQRVRLVQNCLEYRGEISGRRVDDAQNLGGRGLLLQRLARLGQQPRILDCDDRLCREIFQ